MKNLKRLIVSTILLLIILSSVVLAATTSSENAVLEIVEDNVCTINIQDIAIFEKKIIETNLSQKELTIGLKVTNITESIINEPTEIFLVIDNSLSMKEEVSSGVTRLQTVTNSAKTLASTLIQNEYVKLGVVSFSTGSSEGTITDATLLTTPTDNASTVSNAITSIANGELGARTNIDAGITLANQNFSDNINSKYIILLTDGVPNTSLGTSFTYSGQTAINTKAKLQEISNSGVEIFSVMTGVANVEEPTTGITYKALAEEIFGTTENPTVGKFYYIPDSEIEKTVCETILSNFVDDTAKTLNNLHIYDYFPQEIIDNFDIEYVTAPNIGTISPTVDLENNYILWVIDKLEPGEVATVSYKLKLKDEIDTDILDIVLSTNKKVEITADEIKTDDGSNVISSEVTPKVKVTLEEDDDNNTIDTSITDNTIANTIIPQTGNTNTIYIFGLILIASVALIGGRLYMIHRDVK